MGQEFDLVFEGGGAKGYGTTEFDMQEQRLEKLIKAGAEAMKRHLDSRGY